MAHFLPRTLLRGLASPTAAKQLVGVRGWKIVAGSLKPDVPQCMLQERQTRTREDMMREYLMYRRGGTHEGGSEGTGDIHGYSVWKKFAAFVGLPFLIASLWNGYVVEIEHLKHEEEHGRQQFKPYSHLKKHVTEMPWGGYTTLFHNPKTNWLYYGYEDEPKQE